jgi:hypothetical protein
MSQAVQILKQQWRAGCLDPSRGQMHHELDLVRRQALACVREKQDT